MRQRAAGGALVVRVFPGDPLVGGRGAAEATQLAAEGIPFEIVPGVPLETGAAAYAGVPAGTPFCVATLTSDGDADPDWAALAGTMSTGRNGAVAPERPRSPRRQGRRRSHRARVSG